MFVIDQKLPSCLQVITFQIKWNPPLIFMKRQFKSLEYGHFEQVLAPFTSFQKSTPPLPRKNLGTARMGRVPSKKKCFAAPSSFPSSFMFFVPSVYFLSPSYASLHLLSTAYRFPLDNNQRWKILDDNICLDWKWQMITNQFFPVSDIHPVCCAYNRGLLVGSTLLQMLFSRTSGGDDATIDHGARSVDY